MSSSEEEADFAEEEEEEDDGQEVEGSEQNDNDEDENDDGGDDDDDDDDDNEDDNDGDGNEEDSETNSSRKRKAAQNVSYKEDDDDDSDDDSDDEIPLSKLKGNVNDDSDDSDDEIPLSKLKSPTPKSKASSSSKKKSTPKSDTKKKKKVKTESKKSSTPSKTATVTATTDPTSFDCASAALYGTNSKKGMLIQNLLCRWWYSSDIVWPDPATMPDDTPKNYDSLDGFPGVFVCTSGDKTGHILDMRGDFEKSPCFTNFVKKTSEELKELLLQALRKQKAVLIEAEGKNTSTERQIDDMIKWAEKVNTLQADKEAKKVLKAANINLPS